MQQQPPPGYEQSSSSGVQHNTMHMAMPCYYSHTVQQLSQQQYYATAVGVAPPTAAAVVPVPMHNAAVAAGPNQQHGVVPTLGQSSDTINAFAAAQLQGGGVPNVMRQCLTRPPPPLPAVTSALQQYDGGGGAASTAPATTSGGAVGDLGSLLCQLAGYGSAAVGATTSRHESTTAYRAAASVPVSTGATAASAVGAQPAAGSDTEIQSATEKFRQVLMTMGVDNASIQSMQSSLVVALKDRNMPTGPAADATAQMSVESSLHAIAVGMGAGAAVDTVEEARKREKERQQKLDEVNEAYDKLVEECKKFKSELEKTKDKNHQIRKTMRGSKAKTSPLLETNLQLQHTVKQQLNLQLDLKSRLKSLKDFREKQLKEAQDRVKQLKQQQKTDKKTSHRSSKRHKSSKKSKRRSAESDDGDAAAPPPPPVVKYVDGGSHRCDACDVTCDTIFDYCTHLHTGLHRLTIKAAYRPWCTESHAVSRPNGDGSAKVKSVSIKGVDYLVPCLGFYCTLCDTFAGDLICAEEHLKTEAHHNAFKARLLATMNNGVGDDVADMAQPPQTVDAQEQQQFYVDDLNLVVKNSLQRPMGPPLPDDHRRLVHESGRRLKVQLQMDGADCGAASSSARAQQHRERHTEADEAAGHRGARPSAYDRLGAHEHDGAEAEADRDYRTMRYPTARAEPTDGTNSHADGAPDRPRRRRASSPDAELGRLTSSGHASGAQHAQLPVLTRTERTLCAVDQRQLVDCLQRKAQGIETTQDRQLRYRLQRKAEYMTRDNERRH